MVIWFEEQCHVQEAAWPFRGPPRSCSVSFSMFHSVLHHKPKQDLNANAIYNFQNRPRRKMGKCADTQGSPFPCYVQELSAATPFWLSPECGAHWKRQSRHRKQFIASVCCFSHMSPGHCDYSPTSGSFPWGKLCCRGVVVGNEVYPLCLLIMHHVCGLDCYSFFTVASLGSNFHFVLYTWETWDSDVTQYPRIATRGASLPNTESSRS